MHFGTFCMHSGTFCMHSGTFCIHSVTFCMHSGTFCMHCGTFCMHHYGESEKYRGWDEPFFDFHLSKLITRQKKIRNGYIMVTDDKIWLKALLRDQWITIWAYRNQEWFLSIIFGSNRSTVELYTPKLIQNGYLSIALYPLVNIEAPKLTPNQTNWSWMDQTCPHLNWTDYWPQSQRLASGASMSHLNWSEMDTWPLPSTYWSK